MADVRNPQQINGYIPRGDHAKLYNRHLPDSHPISAISGLSEKLEDLDDILIAGDEKLQAEVTRATNAEAGLQANIEAETTRAVGKENELSQKIKDINDGSKALVEAEQKEREAQDLLIRQDIASEIAERQKLDKDFQVYQTKIENEQKAQNERLENENERAAGVEGELRRDLTDVVHDLSDEITRAKNKEDAIEDRLNNSDSNFLEKLKTEQTERQNSDRQLQTSIDTVTSNLNTEAERAEAAEKANATAIKAEEAARKAEDTKLTESISTINTALSEKINKEITERKNEDSRIAGEITAAYKKADSTLKGLIDAETQNRKDEDSKLNTTLTNLINDKVEAEQTERINKDNLLQTNIDNIEKLFAKAVTQDNPAIDKNYVDHSINTSSAKYISNIDGQPFNSEEELKAYTEAHKSEVDLNDYAFVKTKESDNEVYIRFKYDGSKWAEEYRINNSSFNSIQWAAINSGINTDLTKQITINETNIATNVASISSIRNDLNQEIKDRETADSESEIKVINLIEAETTRAKAEEKELKAATVTNNNAIKDEIGRAADAEKALGTRIDSEVVKLNTAINDAVDVEKTAREEAITQLNEIVNTNEIDIEATVLAEINRSKIAEKDLGDNITNTVASETDRATKAEKNILDKVTANESNINTNAANLIAESTAREALEKALEQETTLRTAADATLTQSINTVNTNITNLESKVDKEITRSTEKDDAQDTAISDEIDARNAADSTLTSSIEAINKKIPIEATESNQLADKAFVNNSIASSASSYISDNGQPFKSFEELNAYPKENLKNNDYAIVAVTDPVTGIVKQYDRYKYNGVEKVWALEYTINNSSFTLEQWNAINSGATSALINKIIPNEQNISKNTTSIESNTKDLAKIKPVIPAGATTENKLATEQYVDENGGKIDVISVNNSDLEILNKKVNITVPTAVSQLTNDKDFATKSEMSIADAAVLVDAKKYADDAFKKTVQKSYVDDELAKKADKDTTEAALNSKATKEELNTGIADKVTTKTFEDTLEGYAKTTDIITKTSDLHNDAKFIASKTNNAGQFITKVWHGTLAEYQALVDIDETTIYNIVDDAPENKPQAAKIQDQNSELDLILKELGYIKKDEIIALINEAINSKK